MRRILVVTLALTVLGVAGAAYAAGGPYTGSLAFNTKKAGTKAKPVPIGFDLNIAGSGAAGQRPPVTLQFTVKIYGLRLNGKNFPTCSLSKIAAAHNDTVCPKKALMATGSIQALLGSSTDFSAAGQSCDPVLDVWNSGQGKMTYFFVTTPTHQCLGGALTTGSTPPYPGTYTQSGNYLVTNVRIPQYIDYPVPGLVGSLQSEQLTFKSQSTKVHGKTVISQASVGCTKGKRPYSITVSYSTPTGGTSSQTIAGLAGCS